MLRDEAHQVRGKILNRGAHAAVQGLLRRLRGGEFSPQATVFEFFPATAGTKLVSAGIHENLSEYS
jgi:hypothetical protein